MDLGICTRILLGGFSFGGMHSPAGVRTLVFGCGTVSRRDESNSLFFSRGTCKILADPSLACPTVRTGQAHRTLIGHTAPVTCLQFDEYHLVSGSLDKTVKVWDLRTGSIADTLKYEHPITALQFDSRKIITAAGENGIRVSGGDCLFWRYFEMSSFGPFLGTLIGNTKTETTKNKHNKSTGIQSDDDAAHFAGAQWPHEPGRAFEVYGPIHG
jgi:WD40 repeat protein